MLGSILVGIFAASWRVFLAGSLAGIAVVVLATANPFSFFEIAELKALDAQFTLRGSRAPVSPIVVVTIGGFGPRSRGLALEAISR